MMDYYGSISEFLTGNGINHTWGTVSGHKVIYAENSVILPIEVNAADKLEADRRQKDNRDIITALHSKTGEYPLVITEDRWRTRRQMTQLRLLAHLHIFTQLYARNCEIRKIDKATAAAFLRENHSYGDAACRYRYGLFLKRHTGHNAGRLDIAAGTLVAVATFSNARKWVKADKTIRSYEWTRYASLPGVRLSGGMGKLLKAFIEEVDPDDIMTYADLEWSEGKVYETLGFKLEGVKEPVLFKVSASWERVPVKPERTEEESPTVMYMGTSLIATTGNLYFQNFGSNKYRLKLTDYQ